jgi:tetratricopeptide (TPR) repeat protein
MYLHSFLDGMTFLYKGYETKIGDLKTKINVASIENHYKEFSDNIQFDFPPPLILYKSAGRYNYYQKKYQDCVEALEIYLKKKPTNSYAHELIGDAYFMLGKKDLSLMHYRKSLEISPYRVGLTEKINNFK